MNYDELDPGIRDTVKLLQENGFATTDSGDGSKYGKMGGALPYPHVFIACPHVEDLIDEAERAATLLGDDWEVEASYSTRDKTAILCCQLLSAVIAAEEHSIIEMSSARATDGHGYIGAGGEHGCLECGVLLAGHHVSQQAPIVAGEKERLRVSKNGC